jgi:hypothetical protein
VHAHAGDDLFDADLAHHDLTADEHEGDGRMPSADALRPAFHCDVPKCVGSGQHKLISAVMDEAQVEQVSQCVGLWHGGADDCQPVLDLTGQPVAGASPRGW